MVHTHTQGGGLLQSLLMPRGLIQYHGLFSRKLPLYILHITAAILPLLNISSPPKLQDKLITCCKSSSNQQILANTFLNSFFKTLSQAKFVILYLGCLPAPNAILPDEMLENSSKKDVQGNLQLKKEHGSLFP